VGVVNQVVVDSQTTAEPNNADLEILSALLVYREVAFAGEIRPFHREAALGRIGISLAEWRHQVDTGFFKVKFLSLS
jgi:hypothetical protein